jgi:hypothetical protein
MKSRNSKSRDETLRIVDTQAGRTSRACSLLFQSWLNLGSQVVVGSTQALATTLEDLRDLYCDPGGGLDRQKDQHEKSDRLD